MKLAKILHFFGKCNYIFNYAKKLKRILNFRKLVLAFLKNCRYNEPNMKTAIAKGEEHHGT